MEAAAVSAERQIESGVRVCATIQQIVEPFLVSRQARRRGASAARISTMRRVLCRFASDLRKPIDEVAISDVEAWVLRRYREKGRRSENVSQWTIKGEIDILLGAIRWACGRTELVPEMSVVPLLRMEPIDDERRVRSPRTMPMRALVELLDKLLESHPEIALPCWCMLLTGARPRAVLDLEWRRYRHPTALADGQIRLPALKGGREVIRRVVHGSMLAEVMRQAGARAKEWGGRRKAERVFRDAAGAPWASSLFSVAAIRAAREHGADDWSPYVIRHSIATHCRSVGIGTGDVRDYLAHSNDTTQAVYDHTTGQLGAGAVDEVEGIAKNGRLGLDSARARAREIARRCAESGLVVGEVECA